MELLTTIYALVIGTYVCENPLYKESYLHGAVVLEGLGNKTLARMFKIDETVWKVFDTLLLSQC